jgi:glycosyltransferase involved in cell wall biosynthesis
MGSDALTTIAAVVLTCNEELNIARCIQSLKWADDLIVVDSGSTDETRAIARKLGARVYINSPEQFSASAQRNWALECCSLATEWVLFLDADEECPPALHRELRRVLPLASERVVAYRLAPRFVFMGKWLKHTAVHPAWHDRLIRRGLVRFVGGWPVDRFEPPEGEVGFMRELYVHYGLANGVQHWYSKHNVYSSNVAKQAVEAAALGCWTSPAWTMPLVLRLSHHPFLGAAARFLAELILRGGFLDGYPGWIYAGMRASYQFMIGVKIIEQKRHDKGLTM